MKFVCLAIILLRLSPFSAHGYGYSRQRRLSKFSMPDTDSDYDSKHYGHRHRNRLRRQSDWPVIKPEWEPLWPPPQVVENMKHAILTDLLGQMVYSDLQLRLPSLIEEYILKKTGVSLPVDDTAPFETEAKEMDSNVEGGPIQPSLGDTDYGQSPSPQLPPNDYGSPYSPRQPRPRPPSQSGYGNGAPEFLYPPRPRPPRPPQTDYGAPESQFPSRPRPPQTDYGAEYDSGSDYSNQPVNQQQGPNSDALHENVNENEDSFGEPGFSSANLVFPPSVYSSVIITSLVYFIVVIIQFQLF